MPLPDTPPAPGPGAYEVVDYEGPPKHYMSGAAFVSTTGRWTGGPIPGGNEMPGPGQYHWRSAFEFEFLVIVLRLQTLKHIKGGWSHYTDTSEPVNGNGAKNMVMVLSGFRTINLNWLQFFKFSIKECK
jgi:hypothetical protein